MPKQKGVIKLSGSVDDMTYYQKDNEFFSRKKTSVNGERIASDPQFERTRENNAEFGRGAKAGKLFRNSVTNLLKLASDPGTPLRLTAIMVKVLKTDPISDRGKRMVDEGDLTLLNNFQCNNGADLISTFTGSFTAAIDRSNGTGTITVNDFIPRSMVSLPEGTTHFKFVSAITELNFGDDVFVAQTQESAPMLWDFTLVPAITLTASVTPASTNPIFLLLGLQFFQFVNGKQYPLKDENFNPLSVVAISEA